MYNLSSSFWIYPLRPAQKPSKERHPGSIPTRCPNHINWLLLTRSSFTPILLRMSEPFALSLSRNHRGNLNVCLSSLFTTTVWCNTCITADESLISSQDTWTHLLEAASFHQPTRTMASDLETLIPADSAAVNLISSYDVHMIFIIFSLGWGNLTTPVHAEGHVLLRPIELHHWQKSMDDASALCFTGVSWSVFNLQTSNFVGSHAV